MIYFSIIKGIKPAARRQATLSVFFFLPSSPAADPTVSLSLSPLFFRVDDDDKSEKKIPRGGIAGRRSAIFRLLGDKNLINGRVVFESEERRGSLGRRRRSLISICSKIAKGCQCLGRKVGGPGFFGRIDRRSPEKLKNPDCSLETVVKNSRLDFVRRPLDSHRPYNRDGSVSLKRRWRSSAKKLEATGSEKANGLKAMRRR